MIDWLRTTVCLLMLGLASACSVQPLTLADQGLVLTSTGPLYQLTRSLTDGTGIDVLNIPERPRSLAAQPTFLGRQGEQFSLEFSQADAVVTMGRIWPEDTLYTVARSADIRIVNIDASKPWSLELTGVAVASSPGTGDASPYFWTSPSNIIQSLSILARDLITLYPEATEEITANLEAERQYYLNLKADFETRFLAVADPVVYALADEFVYLTSDLGIFVDDYFIKQDIDWTTADLDRLTGYLQTAGISVVIHKWEPAAEIQEAVAAAGAKLVVLDLQETATEGFRAATRANLDHLLEALSGADP